MTLDTITLGDVLEISGGLIFIILLWSLVGYPKWRVWAAYQGGLAAVQEAHQSGIADLQRAKNEQQVQVAQAQGRLDAANLNKQAAIIEAEAVSEQIQRIGAQLTQHDLYLRWQWIKMMEEMDTKTNTIYVPTEANLPILEANRLK